MDEIKVEPRPLDAFREVIGEPEWEVFTRALAQAKVHLGASTIWHVNSTSTGGGVAEILQSAVGYLAEAGISARWLTIDGNEPFFEVTKRLHHRLHGKLGDGGPLGETETEVYAGALASELDQIGAFVAPGDVVVLHDPQTLGLAPTLTARGATVIWNCHIGADEQNEHTLEAWEFLAPYVRDTSAQIFSRAAYAWSILDPDQVAIIPPCIDAFASKNLSLTEADVASILASTGIEGSSAGAGSESEAAPRTVATRTLLVEETPITADMPLVVQISRWDPLKDFVGVMKGFVGGVEQSTGAHLLLLGPRAEGVSDDPEGLETWHAVLETWRGLPESDRRRVHLANVPMDDIEENAFIVNAVQCRAAVIVQKSLAEGFGLTVTEAMWKSRPVVASAVGGINDQIDSGTNGVLIAPDDLDALARAVTEGLVDSAGSSRMGAAAHRRVVEEYLAPRYLTRHLALVTRSRSGVA